MKNATILFTRRPWSLVSWVIRWSLPVSRFKWARASHSMIVDGDHVIHATMRKGVVREPLVVAMRGQVVVAERTYEVPDLEKGLAWARGQIGTGYDFKAAIGLAIKPDRLWREDKVWFCHELCAAFLHASGRRLFDQFGQVTDAALMLASSKP